MVIIVCFMLLDIQLSNSKNKDERHISLGEKMIFLKIIVTADTLEHYQEIMADLTKDFEKGYHSIKREYAWPQSSLSFELDQDATEE